LSEWEVKKEEIGEMPTWDRPEIQGDYLFSNPNSFLASSRGPPKIKSRDFLKLRNLWPIPKKYPLFLANLRFLFSAK
jgi:hypothetical protein